MWVACEPPEYLSASGYHYAVYNEAITHDNMWEMDADVSELFQQDTWSTYGGAGYAFISKEDAILFYVIFGGS